MARNERLELISRIEAERNGRLLITYVTSTRPNHEVQIADDAVRLIHDHLELGKESAAKGVDLFIHSNGGSGTAPWRLFSLIREYSKELAVLVPHHAFSAETLVALGWFSRKMETGRSLLASIAISRAQFGRHRLVWSRANLAAEPATGFKRNLGAC